MLWFHPDTDRSFGGFFSIFDQVDIDRNLADFLSIADDVNAARSVVDFMLLPDNVDIHRSILYFLEVHDVANLGYTNTGWTRFCVEHLKLRIQRYFSMFEPRSFVDVHLQSLMTKVQKHINVPRRVSNCFVAYLHECLSHLLLGERSSWDANDFEEMDDEQKCAYFYSVIIVFGCEQVAIRRRVLKDFSFDLDHIDFEFLYALCRRERFYFFFESNQIPSPANGAQYGDQFKSVGIMVKDGYLEILELLTEVVERKKSMIRVYDKLCVHFCEHLNSFS